jgi:beta-lactamase regulating signal transducer with metallopeptidase domain
MFPSAPAFDPTASRVSDPPESNQPSAIGAAPSRKENSAWWVTPISTVYVIGLLTVVVHTAAVLFWMRRLRKAGKKLSAEQEYVRVVAARAAAEMNVRRQVEILLSEQLTVPVVCGWFRPAILLPSDAATWSSSHLRSVFLHEMAHLKRRDELTTTFARLSVAWQWFNPLAWMVLKRCNSERERACDDLVLAAGVPATDYADHLVLAAKSAATRWLLPAGVAMDRTSDIEARLSDILDSTRNRKRMTLGSTLLLGLAVVLLITPLASLTARQQGFENVSVALAEEVAIRNTLKEFYLALNRGDDFISVRTRFLSEGYFDSAELTLENREPHEWDDIRKQMTLALHQRQIPFRPAASAAIVGMSADGEKRLVTLVLNVANQDSASQSTWFLRNLEHTIEMVQEGGAWRISRFSGGVTLLQMDTHRADGPTFLLWVEDRNPQTTPLGAFAFPIAPSPSRRLDKTTLTIGLET